MRTRKTDPEKRIPTLADLFIHDQRLSRSNFSREIGEKRVRILQARARVAHRFIFDDEASERVGRVVRDIPELLLRESQFARAPYDLTWIEYRAVPFWQTVNSTARVAEGADTRVGFLIDHNRVNAIAARDDSDCGLYPIAYHLNTEWPLEDQIRLADMLKMSRSSIDLFLWGATAKHFIDKGNHEALRQLRAYNMAEPLFDLSFLPRDVTEKLVWGATGDLRTVIAFLLMLNRPSICAYHRTLPNRRGWIKNRPVGLASHTTVKVNLDAVATLKLIGTPAGDSVPRVRHEVRGHYCQNKTARDYSRIAGCIHEWVPCAGPEDNWEPLPDLERKEVNHWVCDVCEGRRWWRSEYTRGSEEEGVLIKDGYEVTADRE